MYADIGVHLCRVVNVKFESGPLPLKFVQPDTSEIFLMDVNLEHDRFAHMVASRAAEPPASTVDSVGTSCGFETIIPDAAIAEVEPGDVASPLDTGAYQEACASNFNALGRPERCSSPAPAPKPSAAPRPSPTSSPATSLR